MDSTSDVERQLNAIAVDLLAILQQSRITGLSSNALAGELGGIERMLARAKVSMQRQAPVSAPLERAVYVPVVQRMLRLVRETEEAVRARNYDTRALDEARMLIDAIRGRLTLLRENSLFWTAAFDPSNRLSTLPRDVQRLIEPLASGLVFDPATSGNLALVPLVDETFTTGTAGVIRTIIRGHNTFCVMTNIRMSVVLESPSFRMPIPLEIVGRGYQYFSVAYGPNNRIHVLSHDDLTGDRSTRQHRLFSDRGELLSTTQLGGFGSQTYVRNICVDNANNMWVMNNNMLLVYTSGTTSPAASMQIDRSNRLVGPVKDGIVMIFIERGIKRDVALMVEVPAILKYGGNGIRKLSFDDPTQSFDKNRDDGIGMNDLTSREHDSIVRVTLSSLSGDNRMEMFELAYTRPGVTRTSFKMPTERGSFYMDNGTVYMASHNEWQPYMADVKSGRIEWWKVVRK